MFFVCFNSFVYSDDCKTFLKYKACSHVINFLGTSQSPLTLKRMQLQLLISLLLTSYISARFFLQPALNHDMADAGGMDYSNDKKPIGNMVLSGHWQLNI